jgi:hypothetical protein
MAACAVISDCEANRGTLLTGCKVSDGEQLLEQATAITVQSAALQESARRSSNIGVMLSTALLRAFGRLGSCATADGGLTRHRELGT